MAAMSEHNVPAEIAAAKAYEEFFVPALVGEWARRGAAMAEFQVGQHVLDVACATAVLAREAASRLGRTGLGSSCQRAKS